MDNHTSHQQPADKQAYLDSIAVKTKAESKTASIHIPPFAIKLVAVGLVLIVAMLAVTGILDQNNKKLKNSYNELALVINTLSDQSSPLNKYKDKIKSSDLRFQTTLLITTLQGIDIKLKNAITNVGVDTDSYTKEATNAINTQINTMTANFESGYYNGHFDTSFANAVSMQLLQIISLETQIRSKTNDSSIAAIIDESLPQLQEFQTNFIEFADAV